MGTPLESRTLNKLLIKASTGKKKDPGTLQKCWDVPAGLGESDLAPGFAAEMKPNSWSSTSDSEHSSCERQPGVPGQQHQGGSRNKAIPPRCP